MSFGSMAEPHSTAHRLEKVLPHSGSPPNTGVGIIRKDSSGDKTAPRLTANEAKTQHIGQRVSQPSAKLC